MKVVRCVILFSVLACTSQAQTLYRQGDAFTGRVRTARSERATFEKTAGEFLERPRVLIQEANYSPDGRTREVISYNPDGSQGDRYVYTYEIDGKELTFARYDRLGALLERTEYAYDDKGWRTSEIKYGPTGQVKDKLQIVYLME